MNALKRIVKEEATMSNAAEQSELERVVGQLSKAAYELNQTARQLGQIRGIGAAGAGAAAGIGAAASIALTAVQRLICERVINCFETGSIQGDYSDITIFHDGPNDIRQITYGRAQTTEYGNLRELVDLYANAGGMFSNDLKPFVNQIGSVALVDNAQFKDLLHRAGAQDQVMRDTQDVFFDRRYFTPALNWAQTNGFTRALSVLVIYDSFIQSGRIRDELRARFPELVPAQGGNEQTWIRQYVEVRHNWLQNHHRPEVRASAYRTRDLLREIGRNNWDLSILPISANGAPVDARPIGGQMAAAAALPAAIFYPYEAQAGGGDSDPAAPFPGESDDPSGDISRANLGEVPVGAAAAAAAPLMALDMTKAWGFLHACMTSSPRVTYGLGKKVPFFGAIPGRDFTQVDCSGFVREALRRATTPTVAFPDGSVVQHDWIIAQGFA
jgi:chitosanase